MNINSALTKDYEMNNMADPAKTKPILPRLSQRRLGSSLYLKAVLSEESCCRCKACVRARPQVYCSTSRTGRAARNAADTQEGRSKIPVFVLLYMLQSHPGLPARQFLPLQAPHFNAKTFANFHTFKHLFERNSTTFCKFLFTFCTFSNFETLSHTPNPHFQPKIKGAHTHPKFPTPIFRPKTHTFD